MNAYRFHTTVEGGEVRLPMPPYMNGRVVEVVVMDDATVPTVPPKKVDWDEFRRLAEELGKTYDFDAVAAQDAVDWAEAKRSLR